MKNITDMRNELLSVFAGLKDGSVSPKDAAEINNTAGKVIKSCAVQLEYQKLAKDKPNISFLESN